MIAILFVVAVVGLPIGIGLGAGWSRCGAPPWRRHFWRS